MGFSSVNDLVSKMTSGKTNRFDWHKQVGATAYTAGRWYDLSGLGGVPGPNAWAGTALAWTTCNELDGNGTQRFGIPHFGNVSPETKHLINVAAIPTTASFVPGLLLLMDMQGYWPGINMNSSTPQTLTGTPSLRYANGTGCRLYMVTTTITGTTAHNVAISYTNQDGTSGRSMPATVSCTPSAIVTHINHSGFAAANYGPFLPMADGDTGVQNVASVTISAASGAGVSALVLARPILQIPLVTSSVATERDLLTQLPSLPRIIDGACLTWIYFAGAATAASAFVTGSLEYVWG